jgi:hypothetical protein
LITRARTVELRSVRRADAVVEDLGLAGPGGWSSLAVGRMTAGEAAPAPSSQPAKKAITKAAPAKATKTTGKPRTRKATA